MPHKPSRRELVMLLVEARLPLGPVCEELAQYPWDADEPLVTLTATHLESVLHRYLHNDLTAADVCDWANAIEMRDDIGFQAADAASLSRAIALLANPDLDGALTPDRARALISSVTGRTA